MSEGRFTVKLSAQASLGGFSPSQLEGVILSLDQARTEGGTDSGTLVHIWKFYTDSFMSPSCIERPRVRVKSTGIRRAYSVQEFCDRWGIGRNSFYNLLASGELESAKIRNRRVVTDQPEEAFRKRIESAGH